MISTARSSDGAGNQSEEIRPLTLVANQPPSVKQIQILDFRGFNLGDALTEITEGRGIVVHVIASDPEVGVDSVRLYRALGSAVDDTAYERIGQDEAAPFQFHITVPVGQVGEQLSFKADAKDVDGYQSERSSARSLTILADQPPAATIVKPDTDESINIEFQYI